MSRTEEFGAVARGQTFSYLPEALVIVTDPDHALYDPSAEDPPKKSFIDSVRAEGVKIPILVRKNGLSRGKPIIEVMAGRNRVKALRIVNEERRAAGAEPLLIPAIYHRADDGQASICMIIENEQRKVEDHVTRALKLKRELARNGGDEKAAKLAFGLSSTRMRLLLSVLDMDPEVQAALKAKTITMGIAQKLAALPREKQRAALAELLDGKGKARGKEAAAKAEEKTNGAAKPRTKPVKRVQSALDNASCMPKSDYQQGVLHALEWMLGAREAAWAGEDAAKVAGKAAK